MPRTAYASVIDNNSATTSISYDIPDTATEESVLSALDIVLDAHVKIHGDDLTSLTVDVQFLDDEDPEPATDEDPEPATDDPGFRIEMWSPSRGWERSVSFPGHYAWDDAKDRIKHGSPNVRYRLVPAEFGEIENVLSNDPNATYRIEVIDKRTLQWKPSAHGSHLTFAEASKKLSVAGTLNSLAYRMVAECD